MSSVAEKPKGVVGKGSDNERTAKAAITRKITAEKRGKLSPENDYAYSKVVACRRSLDRLADHFLSGGSATGELLDVIGQLDSHIGRAMFA